MENNKHICKYCGKEFETAAKLGGHVSRCKENPKYKETINKIQKTRKENLNINNPIEEHICKCQYCGNNYQINHIRHNDFIKGKYNKTCSSECAHKLTNQNTDLKEKNKKISDSLKGKSTWIKGKKKINNSNINNQWTINPNWTPYHICPICGKEYKNNGRKYCSDKCLQIGRSQNLSKALKGKSGGLRPNAYKKYKSGLYHGIHCDSSWELAFVIYCEEHNISIERNHKYLTYIFEDKEYKYYPDFIINNTLYEIKGYENDKAKAKHEQHPEVTYLDKQKMQKYLNYVINKYGNDFIKLYDRLDKQVE